MTKHDDVDYVYTATLFDPGLWVVRRWRKGAEQFQDECQVRVSTEDPDEAIRAAIAQGSWA